MNEKIKKFLNYFYVFLAGIGTVLLILLGRSSRNDNNGDSTRVDRERDRINESINSIDRGFESLAESNQSAEEESDRINRIKLELETTNREIERSTLSVTERLGKSKDISQRNVDLLRELTKRISNENN